MAVRMNAYGMDGRNPWDMVTRALGGNLGATHRIYMRTRSDNCVRGVVSSSTCSDHF